MCVHAYMSTLIQIRNTPARITILAQLFWIYKGFCSFFAFIKRFVRFDFKTEQKIYVRRKTLLKLHKVCLHNLNNALY